VGKLTMKDLHETQQILGFSRGKWKINRVYGQWTIFRVQENMKDKYCDKLKTFCYVKQASQVLEGN
jgi:hypothetical protein